jgi:hypothetical protein
VADPVADMVLQLSCYTLMLPLLRLLLLPAAT